MDKMLLTVRHVKGGAMRELLSCPPLGLGFFRLCEGRVSFSPFACSLWMDKDHTTVEILG